ncbi:tRNA (adenosine(37)-N6)-threonylcarbamoyltransferase complex transferase subunit TsaD [bacterium]|nr:tRNA (adenosine(37)-N6)-threonylcarbamoyltransferase complex transferase subunit TsaD [bacterium]MCK4326144.1 tRNA (adenosine(37)-N6)-threonylcarbamoyltransferase complex transferase subunit TsaD [bacterium]
MLVLGIETSCDETAAAIVEDGRKIHSNIVASQLRLHKKFGGVVPELASRAHLRAIPLILKEAYQVAKASPEDIGAIAVTQGPGLIGSLLVGVSTAKALSYVHNLPLIGINHLEGHIYSNFLTRVVHPPFLSLIVSGGHTSLVLVKDYGKYELLGATRDDAAGEAYDKVGKLLGLGYPGGPAIDRLAQKGDSRKIKFPRPYLPHSFDFSFSGLKTAVLYYLKRQAVDGPLNRDSGSIPPPTSLPVTDIAASFQAAVVDVLVKKSLKAVNKTKVKKLVVGGGVTANTTLRRRLKEEAAEAGIRVYIPPRYLSTDNAAMIASAGYYRFQQGCRSDSLTLNAVADLKLS